jgi:XTP/dITP diphosphohydrolase
VKLIAATNNNGKIKEIKQILSGFTVYSLKDLNFNEEIEENGSSFQENAIIKAKAVYHHFHTEFPDYYVLADDSGLEVEALGGKPGIFSARYAGPGSTQEMLINKLLAEMAAFSNGLRNARFYCSVALISPDGDVKTSGGFCEGRISTQVKGNNGFGYDPVFLVKESNYEKTMAELTDDEKNSLSHRRMALEGIKKVIKR